MIHIVCIIHFSSLFFSATIVWCVTDVVVLLKQSINLLNAVNINRYWTVTSDVYKILSLQKRLRASYKSSYHSSSLAEKKAKFWPITANKRNDILTFSTCWWRRRWRWWWQRERRRKWNKIQMKGGCLFTVLNTTKTVINFCFDYCEVFFCVLWCEETKTRTTGFKWDVQFWNKLRINEEFCRINSQLNCQNSV